MLYRHLPKIANKVFSILTLDLRNGSSEKDRSTLLEAASNLGVTLAYGGAGVGSATVRREGVSLILHCTESTAEGLRAFLDEAKAEPGDILLVDVPNPEAARKYRDNGLFQAAFAARGTRVCACGFYAPGDAARPAPDTALTAAAAIEADARWDCWATDYSFLREDLAETIRAGGANGIPLIALDPFAGGILENPPAAVHELYRTAPTPRSRDEWALRAIWENQNALTAVCPASGPAQLLGRVAFAEAGRPNSLPARELSVIEGAAALLQNS